MFIKKYYPLYYKLIYIGIKNHKNKKKKKLWNYQIKIKIKQIMYKNIQIIKYHFKVNFNFLKITKIYYNNIVIFNKKYYKLRIKNITQNKTQNIIQVLYVIYKMYKIY